MEPLIYFTQFQFCSPIVKVVTNYEHNMPIICTFSLALDDKSLRTVIIPYPRNMTGDDVKFRL